MGKISDLRFRQDTNKNWRKAGLQEAELAMLKDSTIVADKTPCRRPIKKSTPPESG